MISGFLSTGHTTPVPEHRLRQQETRRAFQTLRRWALTYLATSVLALAAAFPLTESIGAWIRSAVVMLIAAVINVLVARSEEGHRRAYRILRVFAYLESLGFVVVALIVPGYPLWLRITQAVIGVFAVGTAVATSNIHLRRTFAKD
jgi:hypothetical protein